MSEFKGLYPLWLEKLCRDVALSTAIGGTAGLRAVMGDESLPLRGRVDAALDEVLEEVERPPALEVGEIPALQNGAPMLKRPRGRPRKHQAPETEQ